MLAAACDLRIAATTSYFSIPEVDLGIPLAWGGIPRLVREIGPALTKELVMTCRPFTSDEALAAGFLNRVVPAADLDQSVEDLVAQLLTKSSLTLRATKRHVDAVTRQMVGLDRSWADADSLVSALRDPESRASAKAYLDRVRKKDVTTPIDDVLDDLVAEYDRLESILESLTDDQWRSESDAPGLDGHRRDDPPRADRGRRRRHDERPNEPNRLDRGGVTLDDWVDRQVAAERDEPTVVFARWKAATARASVDALRTADPDTRLLVGSHAAQAPHARDDSARRALGACARRDRAVRHPVARHRPSAPHRVARAQHAAVWLRVERPGGARGLRASSTAPDGASVWRYGPADAESKVTGSSGRVLPGRRAAAHPRRIGPGHDGSLRRRRLSES